MTIGKNAPTSDTIPNACHVPLSINFVITDVVEAQKEYKRVLKDAKMVIMVSTMLHSIATGNMLPADVKVIVVDISQPTVTKLMDRGTWQALGIVTDVGAFLPMVIQEIKKIRK